MPIGRGTATLGLREAILHSEIKHGDREANMLLNLPEQTEEAIEQWVREMRLGDTNSDSLIAACRYGTARLRALDHSLEVLAAELSAISADDAKACVTRLGLMRSV